LDLEDFNLLVMKQARWICCLGYQPDVNSTVVSVLKLLEFVIFWQMWKAFLSQIRTFLNIQRGKNDAMARVSNLHLLRCVGSKTVSLIKMKIKSQQRFPIKNLSHPTKRNPALKFNFIAQSNIALQILKIMPAHKKAKTISEKSQRIHCGSSLDFFPRIQLMAFIIKINERWINIRWICGGLITANNMVTEER
jgi:hypothetical protein